MPERHVPLGIFRSRRLPGDGTRWQGPGGERLQCMAPAAIKSSSWQSVLTSGEKQCGLQRLALVQPMTGAARGCTARFASAMAHEPCEPSSLLRPEAATGYHSQGRFLGLSKIALLAQEHSPQQAAIDAMSILQSHRLAIQ